MIIHFDVLHSNKQDTFRPYGMYISYFSLEKKGIVQIIIFLEATEQVLLLIPNSNHIDSGVIPDRILYLHAVPNIN